METKNHEPDIDGFDDVDIEGMENEIKKSNNIVSSTTVPMEETEKSELMIYSAKCLNCSHLCYGIEGTKVETCTAENGNDRCPAQYVQVSIAVDVVRIASKIYEAKVNLNMKTLSRRMARLEKLPPTTIKKVLDKVDEMSSYA